MNKLDCVHSVPGEESFWIIGSNNLSKKEKFNKLIDFFGKVLYNYR